MFLRRHRKEAGGEDCEYWSLVKTVRTARGPRHQIVARPGKLDGAEARAARGWEDLDALLEGSAPSRQLSLTPEPASEPLWKEMDVREVKVERLRQFGRVYLGLALWRTLEQWMRAKGLGDCARQLLLELDELRSMDVILPTRPAGEIRLRVVARPEKALAQLLAHLGLDLPRTPKILENVVPKTAS